MASTEDENYEGSILEGKEKKHETTSVIAGDVVLPESGFGRQRDHKVKNFDKPVRCGKKNCRSNADARVHTYDDGPKNLCFEHWNKFKGNTHLYDPQSFVALRPEEGKDWRGEDRVNRQVSRANAEVALAPIRGFHVPVMGPGNPREVIDPEAEIETEDHVTPVINSAVENGGRNRVEIPLVDFKNLLHQRKIGGKLPTNDEEIEGERANLRSNPSTATSNSFDDYNSLMSSDFAPLPRDTKN